MKNLNVLNETSNEIRDKKQTTKKPKELVWNVFNSRWTANGDEIVVENVFDLNWPFLGRLYKVYKKYKDDFDMFSKEVRSILMCEYWSRCEYEILISDMFTQDKSTIKVDVYQQVLLNWDNFINYLWENKKLISKYKSYYTSLKEVYKNR